MIEFNYSSFFYIYSTKVATHSGKFREFSNCSKISGKLREFLSYRKSKGNSGKFKIKKISGIFFLDLEWDLVNPIPIFVQKNSFIYF